MNYKKVVLVFGIISLGLKSFAQTEGVSIAPTVTPPDPSAMLEVKSANKGLLIPRVTLVALNDPAPIITPVAKSLMVFNEGSNVSEGYYYWDGIGNWIPLGGGALSIPKVTYVQMQAMLASLTPTDLGLQVYVTDEYLPLGHFVFYACEGYAPDFGATHGLRVSGLWYYAFQENCGNLNFSPGAYHWRMINTDISSHSGILGGILNPD